MSVKRAVVLVSGSGSNLQSLIDKVHNKYCIIERVLSDKKDAYALIRAEKAGIAGEYIPNENLFENLYRRLDEINPDLVVLAGFMRILPGKFYDRFKNAIINIHPALIPSFCGKGFYGIKVHEKALEYGVKVTGVTVHFADDKADTGPIILQEAVKVEDDDTPETLQKRVLQTEHEILPKAVRLFCEDRLEINNRRVKIKK